MNKTTLESTKTEARRGDGVIVVLQNNAERSLVIEGMNEPAEALLGFEKDEAKGRKFEILLGSKTAEFLAEEIEYSPDAPDLGEVLSKQRDIRLRNRSGAEIVRQCKISRLMARGAHACFQLLVPNERDALARQKIRDFIALNLEGRKEVDARLGIPNRATAEAFLPLLKTYLAESGLEASFAVIRLDRYEKSVARYGADACMQLLQHMANCCRTSFRAEDIVFVLSDKTLGVVLFDIGRESARLVLNRLRWKIRNHHIMFGGKPNFSITGTVGFDMIDAARGYGVLERCEAAIAEFSLDERNGLVELGA